MNSVPRRENDRNPVTASRAVDWQSPAVDWQSPWPKRHSNSTESVSPAQQTENMKPKVKKEYNTDPDKKTGTIMKKSDIQKRDGWVSPWPVGHPNYTPSA